MISFDGKEVEKVSDLDAVKPPVGGVFLVDFSWLLHRSHYAHRDLSINIKGVEIPTGAIHGVLRSLTAIIRRRPNYSVILCVDGKSKERYRVCPEYKAGRDDTEKAEIYSLQEEILQAACLLPGVSIAYSPDYEADDLIYTFSEMFSKIGKVLIYASDKDLYQCLADGDYLTFGPKGMGHFPVRMFSKLKPRGFEEIGPEQCVEKFGVPPISVVLFRAIRGDTSDNLKGYLRFPSKVAVLIAKTFQSPKEFLACEDRTWEERLTPAQGAHVQKLIDKPSLLQKNYFVMKLKKVPSPLLFRVPQGESILEKYQLKFIQTKVDDLGVLHEQFSR